MVDEITSSTESIEKVEIMLVPFEQEQLTLVISSNDQPYVALRPICENIGLDWSTQLKALKDDVVLSEAVVNLPVNGKGGMQETTCIPLELLNGWLFKINENRVGQEAKQKLVAYKRECYRTLYDYFANGFALNINKLDYDIEAQKALAKRIRRMRTEEKNMFAAVREVFKAKSADYETADDKQLRSFYAMVQDKFHYAITEKVAARIILERADASKDNMGLMSMKGDKPRKQDITVAKNYLTADELQGLENICEQFMLFIESKVFRNQMMTLEEMSTKLNILLMANDYPVLYEYDSYQRNAANAHALKEYNKYRFKISGTTLKSITGVFTRKKNSTD